mmetsp:Transcript_17713/g.20083  ORF Transcript_17713/g.20083 Transcript_17713/m.20083 type:complete len:257 (+) Transcript_17713:97-867(+)
MATQESTPTVISMWSAPRSLSTVLYFSFGQHSDCKVFDEPLLFYFFKKINFCRPGIEQYVDSEESEKETHLRNIFHTDHGKQFHYIKNMCFQWIDIEDQYFAKMKHCFLIREPKRMVASFLKHRECSAEDFAYDKMWKFYEEAVALGQTPVVVDSDEIAKDPKTMLAAFCKLNGMPFEENMLTWEPGAREEQIILPDTWYGEALKSTGFKTVTGDLKPVDIDARFQHVIDEMQPFYDRLVANSLTLEKAIKVMSED